MVRRTYKFRIYPTQKQIRQLAIEFGHARFVWNWALDMRSKAYQRRKQALNAVSISRILTELKASRRYAWLSDASSSCHTQKLRDMDTAFKHFFQRRAGYPRFKKKASHQSVRYQLDQRHIARTYAAGKRLQLPKLGPIKIKWSRLPQGLPKMVTISRDSLGRYFVSMSVEEVVVRLEKIDKAVGLDLGIKDLIVSSDGYKSGAPKYYRVYQRRLAHLQRGLSRKQKGSKRREKQRLKVARVHAKIADSRRDFVHQLSSKVIHENQVIAIEDLNVSGMRKNRRLSKSISDSSMYELRRQLEYKALWYGRELRICDRFQATSKVCHVCNHERDELPLRVREWVCAECGSHHDRDVNAAVNILNFATARSAGSEARGA